MCPDFDPPGKPSAHAPDGLEAVQSKGFLGACSEESVRLVIDCAFLPLYPVACCGVVNSMEGSNGTLRKL